MSEWKSCPECGISVKKLDRHVLKAHRKRQRNNANGTPQAKQKAPKHKGNKKRKQLQIGRGFVDCEYCSASMSERVYADHVKRRHPGKPIRSRPIIGAEIERRGLSDALKGMLRKLPGYQQKYRLWYREVQGGAAGNGRRGR